MMFQRVLLFAPHVLRYIKPESFINLGVALIEGVGGKAGGNKMFCCVSDGSNKIICGGMEEHNENGGFAIRRSLTDLQGNLPPDK